MQSGCAQHVRVGTLAQMKFACGLRWATDGAGLQNQNEVGENMCDEDARDEEAGYYSAMAAGQFHEVVVDVTIRVTVDIPGESHESNDIDEDFVSEQALLTGDIVSVEEVG